MKIGFNQFSEDEVNEIMDKFSMLENKKYRELSIIWNRIMSGGNFDQYEIKIDNHLESCKFSLFGRNVIKDQHMFMLHDDVSHSLFGSLIEIEKIFKFGGKKLINKKIKIRYIEDLEERSFAFWSVYKDSPKDIYNEIFKNIKEKK